MGSEMCIRDSLGSLATGIPLVFKPTEVQNKSKWYGAKAGKPAMIGIVAKMAVKPDRAKKINLKLLSPSESKHSVDEMGNLFMEILTAKYAQNPVARKQLVLTENKYLVEFDRGAVRESKAGRCPLWTGQVYQGTLVGMNFQGELQMLVRALQPANTV